MELSNGQKFVSKKTGNTLTIADMRGKRLMVNSSDGSESMHNKDAFQEAVASGEYVPALMGAVELSEKIEQVHAVEIKGGFRIEAELSSGEHIVLKKKSTRKPTSIQLYTYRANGNSPADSVGKYFGFAKKIEKYQQNPHLKTYFVD